MNKFLARLLELGCDLLNSKSNQIRRRPGDALNHGLL